MNTHLESPKEEFCVMELAQSGKIQPRIIDPIYPPVTQSRSRLDSSHPGSKRLSLSSGLTRAALSIFGDGATPKYSNGKGNSSDQKWNGIQNMFIVPGGPLTYPVQNRILGSLPRKHRQIEMTSTWEGCEWEVARTHNLSGGDRHPTQH